MFKIESSTFSASPVASDNPQVTSSPEDSENPEKKTVKSKKVPRPSASKKYSGQIAIGICKLVLSRLQYSRDIIDKKLIDIIMVNVLGKRKEDYKLNNVEKLRKFFIIEPEDDFLTKQVKQKFSMFLCFFFSEPFYSNWVYKEFKGSEESKEWYIINKEPLKERIIFNRKSHFYVDAKTCPYTLGVLTQKDDLYNDITTKKIKIEEKISD